MILQKVNSFILVILIGMPACASALSTDHQQPVQIEAEEVVFDKQKGISRYNGNVQFKQGSLIIKGGTILLYHRDGLLDKVIINGQPASFQQTPDKGNDAIVSRAHRMEYLASQSRLLLYKDARVTHGKNVFSGEMIEYDIVKGTVVANKGDSNGRRINAILEESDITPQKTP